FAVRSDAESKRLLAAVGGSSAKIDVFNTESWTRTNLVLIPAAKSKAGDRVVDAAGKTVPSQRIADGSLAVLVRDIAPFSSRRYSILPGKAARLGNASAKGNVIKNAELSATIDPQSGAIVDLRMKGLAGNLVDTKSKTAVNDYFYLPNSDVKGAVRNGAATITVEDPGPLVATLRIDSDAPGLRHLTRRVRLVSGVSKVDLADIIDKLAIREKEGLHIGFGFNVPNATMRMEMPLAVVRPEQDQLPAANKNWYPVQHWVDVSNSQYGVTWATLDAPLVEVGGLTANIPGYVSQTDPRWLQRTASSATFYSWVMNNHWHTNYKADQEGPVTFRYAIAPHGAFAADAAARFGQGVSRPLVALLASGNAVKGSLLQVSSPRVTVSELKPSDDGKAWIVRLWGASGRAQTVKLSWKGKPLTAAYLSNTTEKAGAKIGPNFAVPGYGVVTLRIPRS
ncbi:glycoside hydrolase, partial [bacterium]